MSSRRLAVRLVAEGGRNVKAEFRGVGEAGEQAFSKIDARARAVSRRITLALAAMATAAVATAGAMIRSGLQVIDNQAKLAASLNTTVASIQVLERAGDLAGVSMREIEQATMQLTRRLSQVAAGAGPATEALRRLRLSAEDLQALPLDQRIALIQDRLADMVPEAQRAAVAAQLFGDRAALVFGRIDSEALRQANQDLVDFGVLVSDQDAAQIERTNDAISRLGLLWRGVANQLTIAVAPAMEAVVDAMARFASVNGPLGRSIQIVFDNLGRLASTAAAFAAFIGGRYVASFIAARVATMRLSGALVLLRGALIRTGIGALIVGAGELIYWFSRLVRGAGGFGEAMGLLRDVAVEAWDRIKGGAIGLGAAMATVWYDFKADTAEAMQAALESVVGFGNNALNTFEGAYEAIKVIWGNLPSAIGDFAFQAANALISGVEAMLNAVVDRINRFVAGLNDALSHLPDWLTGGEPVRIGTIERLQLGRITNQFEGAAARAGTAAREAFQAAFDSDTIEVPDFGLEDIARASRQTAQEFREAYQDIFAGLTLPLESWEGLRQAMVAAGEDGTRALDDVAASGDRVEDALNRAGGAGGRAGRAVRDAAEEAKVGWDALLEKLNQYVEQARDIGAEVGDVIVGAFRGAEDAIANFVRTGKLSFRDMVNSMIADLARLAARRFILGPLMGALSSALGNMGGSFGAAMASALAPARSFDGGGHTGYGARVGGLDGRGGYLAMVHPRERIIDETRGARRGREMAPVVVNIATRDAESFRQSRTQIAADMQRAVAMGRRGM